MIYLITVYLGVLLPYFLQSRFKLNPILASAIPSVILGIIAHFAFQEPHQVYLSLFYGATFVGMTIPQKASKGFLIASPIIYMAFFAFLTPVIQGLGGLLGAMALGTTIVSLKASKKIESFL